MDQRNDASPLAALGPTRRVGPECLSDLALDRLLGGETTEHEAARCRSHLSACAACGGALTALTGQREAFANTAPINQLVTAVMACAEREARPAQAWWRKLWRPVALPVALSAAAALALFVTVRPPAANLDELDSASATVRRKGGFALSTYVKWKDQEAPGTLHLGQPLSEGDRVAFRVTSDRPGQLAILSVDSRAEVSVYYPAGPNTAPISPGRDLPLDTAVALDGSPGKELVIGLRCDLVWPVEQLVARVTARIGQARAAGLPATALGALDLPCAEVRVELQKAPPPPAR